MDPPTPDPPDPPDPTTTMDTSSEPWQLVSNSNKRRLVDENQSVSQSISKKTIITPELASASIQNVFISNTIVIGIKAYTSTDKGPFLVHISRTEPDPSAGTTIRPIKFGQFLVHNKVQNICPDGVKKVGRNKLSVEFRSAADANKFLDNPVLTMCKYEASIPSYNITKMGIVRQIPVDLSMDEFVESLELPIGCGEVLKARRLNRKSIDEGKISWVPTQTVVLTFHGQFLPSKIFSFHTSLPVEIYHYPTIQCLSCCRFGHIKAQCRSKPRCYRCAQPHTGDSCSVEECKATCLYCSGQHFASNKNCPEQGRQRSIKLLMSQEGVSYEDASNQCPKTNRSFAEVAQDMYSNPFPTYQAPTRPPIPNYITSNQSGSYRKTLPTPPRPRALPEKSYDREAHQAIVGNIPSSLPNGCALLNDQPPAVSQEEGLLDLLLTLIINIISRQNSIIPSNVAQKLMSAIALSSNNNGSNVCSSVEQRKPPSEKV